MDLKITICSLLSKAMDRLLKKWNSERKIVVYSVIFPRINLPKGVDT